MTRLGPPPTADLEAWIDAYEQARQCGPCASLREFLPPPDHPDYLTVAAELARVDLEYAWECGAPLPIEHYRELLPEALADSRRLAEIAFEEFRLRRQAGQNVDPREYEARFAIDASDWPRLPSASVLEGGPAAAANDARRGPASGSPCGGIGTAGRFPGCGEDVAGFRLHRELGRGAFARAFLATQTALSDRPVVLKLAPGASLEPQHLARLQHANIVPIYSVHSERGFTAVCMPYLGEQTLADFLRQVADRKSLPETGEALVSTLRARLDETLASRASQPESPASPAIAAAARRLERLQRTNYVSAVADVVRQLAEGLAHAHDRGIVHRDLKPANVLLTTDAVPMLLDFNLSTDAAVHGAAGLGVGGTLPYMAPEHLRAVLEGGRVDARCDVFSLGVLLYELLTGQRPFPDRYGPPEAAIPAMLADRASPVWNWSANPAVTPDLRAIVAKCLAPAPERRYQAAAHVAVDLDRRLRDLPLQYAPNTSLVERSRKWLRRHPHLRSRGVVALATCACLAVTLVATTRSNSLRTWQLFRERFPTVRAQLSAAERDPELVDDGLRAARDLLGLYAADVDAAWAGRWAVRCLPAGDRLLLRDQIGEVAYLASEAALRTADGSAADQARRIDPWRRIAAAAFVRPPRALALLAAAPAADSSADDDPLARLVRDAPVEQDWLAAAETSPLDLRLLALRRMAEGDYLSARLLLTRLRDRTPHDASCWLLLGNTYAAAADHASATICFDAASALSPHAAAYLAHFHRGLSKLAQGDYSAAIADFALVVQRRPDLVGGYLNRGLAYAAAGHPRAAISDFTTALRLGHAPTRVYFLRARSWQAVGEAQRAADDVRQGLALTPHDALSWIARGMVRLPRDPQGAWSDFRAAHRLDPANRTALRNIAHVTADRLDQPAEALAALDALLALDPTDDAAAAGRAVALARMRRTAEARDATQSLLQRNPPPILLLQAACAYSLTSREHPADAQQALDLLRSAIHAEPALAQRAQTDADLTPLRAHPGFAAAIAPTTPPSSSSSPAHASSASLR